MAEPTSSPATPRTAAEYEVALDQLLVEMKRLNERMASNRAEINRIKAETDELKSQGAILDGETRAVLDRLQAAV